MHSLFNQCFLIVIFGALLLFADAPAFDDAADFAPALALEAALAPPPS